MLALLQFKIKNPMMAKKYLILITLVFIAIKGFSQSKKTIKAQKIKTIIETKTEGAKTITESKIIYDKDGNPTEIVDYNKEGQIKSIHKLKYNSEGDEIEDLEYNSSNNLVEKKITKYSLIGEKTEEVYFDAAGKQIKKTTYTYDSKGLKTEKKTTDDSGKVISVKHYTYTK